MNQELIIGFAHLGSQKSSTEFQRERRNFQQWKSYENTVCVCVFETSFLSFKERRVFFVASCMLNHVCMSERRISSQKWLWGFQWSFFFWKDKCKWVNLQTGNFSFILQSQGAMSTHGLDQIWEWNQLQIICRFDIQPMNPHHFLRNIPQPKVWKKTSQQNLAAHRSSVIGLPNQFPIWRVVTR